MVVLFPLKTSSNQPVPLSCSVQLLTALMGRVKGREQGEKWRSICEQQNLEGLSESQKEQFASLVKEYKNMFVMNSSDLRISDSMEHEINTGDCTPIKQPPRCLPPHLREVIYQQLDELIATGRVQQSQSPWSSPVDFRRPNQYTQKRCLTAA